MTLTLKHGSTTRDFDPLSVRGYDYPDEWYWVAKAYQQLDGDKGEVIRGFQRIITVDFGILDDLTDAKFLLDFAQDANRSMTRNGLDEVFVALDDPTVLTNEWLDNTKLGRHLVWRFIDRQVRTQWYTREAEAGETMYLKRKVQITGTLSSPQTITTNSAPLGTDQTGNAYPTFSSSTHVFHVAVNGAPYQEAHIVLVTEPSVVAGKLQFQVAIQDHGQASSDGNYYADIAIFLQGIP